MRIVLALFVTFVATVSTAQSLGLSGLHAKKNVGNKVCFTSHTHYNRGTGKTEAQALHRAIRNWESFTAFEYGRQWGSFELADSPSIVVECVDNGDSFSCSVEARPCRRR